MTLRPGENAPDFLANTTLGDISFYSWLDTSWALFFSHPADFTAVCTSELGRTSQLSGEFEKRNVKLLCPSVDPIAEHVAWTKDINATCG